MLSKSTEGINYLVNNGIMLAADDFDHIRNDFRVRGLRSLIYIFVKLKFSQNEVDVEKFYNMIDSCKKLGVNIIF